MDRKLNWRNWTGGNRPAPDEARVVVRFRSGLTAKGAVSDFRWRWRHQKDDITGWAYE